jgi:hypothetical protein
MAIAEMTEDVDLNLATALVAEEEPDVGFLAVRTYPDVSEIPTCRTGEVF